MENENGSFSFEARDRSPAQVSFISYLNSPGGSLQPKGGGDIGDRSVKRMRDGTNTEDSYLTPSESGESWAKPGEKAGFSTSSRVERPCRDFAISVSLRILTIEVGEIPHHPAYKITTRRNPIRPFPGWLRVLRNPTI